MYSDAKAREDLEETRRLGRCGNYLNKLNRIKEHEEDDNKS